MNRNRYNDILYTLCAMHIDKIERSVVARPRRSLEEGAAISHIASHMLNIAAGAALVCGYPEETTNDLVRKVKNIEDYLEWNVRSSTQ